MGKNGPGPPGQEDLAPQREDLVTLNRAATVARLVSGVFHELNNSLQVIGGLAELLQDAPGVPGSVADGLRRIHGQQAKAAGAIAEVMLFTRQKADARGRVNMRDLAVRSVGLRSFAIGRARLSLAFDPPTSGQVDVNGYAVLLQQAVLNLIVNAEQVARRSGRRRDSSGDEPAGRVGRAAGLGQRPRRRSGDRRSAVRALRDDPSPRRILRPGSLRGPSHRRATWRHSHDGGSAARRVLRTAPAGGDLVNSQRVGNRTLSCALFDVQALQLVDERRAAQVEQPRGLPLVAAGLLQAAQDQVALELRHDRGEVEPSSGNRDRRHQHRAGALAHVVGSASGPISASPPLIATACSMAFSNWRMLPGQS